MSTGAVVARTSRNLINRRGPILHVATELKNVGQRGYLANLVHRVASQQISTGLDARVVLPHSPELDLSQLEDIDDQGTHLQGTFDGIPVYVLKHSEEVEHCFSAVYPTGEDALQDYLHFGKVFWQMVGEEVFGDTPLVHLWDHTAGWMAGQRPMALGRVRTVFTPVEPETHFQDFPLDQIEEYAGQADLFGFRTVSGFMVGFEHADVITEWHRGFFGQLKKNVPVLNPFLTPFLKRGNVHSLRCAGWRPVQETELPSACIDALNEAYYQALYGTGYDFSIQVADAPMTDVDALLVSAVEKHPEDRRSPLLVRRMKQEHPDIGRIEAVTRYVARYLGEVIQGFRGNVGGVVQMLKNIDENPDTNPQGLYFAFLNGGDGERGFVTTA